MFTAQRNAFGLDPQDSSASDSENELMARHRQIAATHGGPPVHKLVTSLAAVKAGRMRSATVGGISARLDPNLEGDLQDLNLPPGSPALLRSRLPSSSSGTDSDEDGEPVVRARTAKMLARQASLAAVRKPRQPSWSDRRPSFGGSTAKPSRQASVDRNALSRQGASLRAKESKDSDVKALAKASKVPSSAELHRVEGVEHVREVRELVKEIVKASLKEYAERVRGRFYRPLDSLADALLSFAGRSSALCHYLLRPQGQGHGFRANVCRSSYEGLSR